MNWMNYLNWTSLNCPFYEASFSFDSFDRSQIPNLKNSKNAVCDDVSSRRYLTNWKYHGRLDVRQIIEILILRRDADLSLVDPEGPADLEDLEARGDPRDLRDLVDRLIHLGRPYQEVQEVQEVQVGHSCHLSRVLQVALGSL